MDSSGIHGGNQVHIGAFKHHMLTHPQDIWIFDIDLQKWYMQKATGDIPPNRARFCGGVAWVDDRSSYNMYVIIWTNVTR